MLILGVLLAVSLATIVAVLMSCELQTRATRATATVITIPSTEHDDFERIIAPLLADPNFGNRYP